MRKFVGWLLAFLLLLPIGLAQDIEDYRIDYQIVGDKAFVTHDLSFLSSTTSTFEFGLPEDAKEIMLEVDGKANIPLLKDNVMQIQLNPFTKKIKITYITGYHTETKDEFLVDVSMPYDARNLEVKVALPEEAVLRRPLSEGGSVFPKADNVETDGLQISITWTAENLKQGDGFGAFVLYRTPSEISPSVYSIIIFLVIIIIILIIIKTKKKIKITKKLTEKPSKHVHEDISSHLKEDEKQIVNVLKQRDGQCEQGTLRVVTGIPKASLSRLLMELEARNIIYKEKRGKKNIIFLKS